MKEEIEWKPTSRSRRRAKRREVGLGGAHDHRGRERGMQWGARLITLLGDASKQTRAGKPQPAQAEGKPKEEGTISRWYDGVVFILEHQRKGGIENSTPIRRSNRQILPGLFFGFSLFLRSQLDENEWFTFLETYNPIHGYWIYAINNILLLNINL